MTWKITIERNEGADRTCKHTEEGEIFKYTLLDCIRSVCDHKPYIHAIEILSNELEFDELGDEVIGDAAYEFIKVCHAKGNVLLKEAVGNFSFDKD